MGEKLFEKLFDDRNLSAVIRVQIRSISIFYDLQLLFYTLFEQTSFCGRFVAAKMGRSTKFGLYMSKTILLRSSFLKLTLET